MAKEIKVTIATCWEDVTLAQFERLLAVDDSASNEDKYIDAIAALSNLSREEVLDLPYPDFVKLSTRLDFMKESPKERPLPASLTIDGKEYDITRNISQLTAAQFLDYKTMLGTPNLDRRLARLCSCFIVPKGHKYGDGYDTDELISTLYEHMGVVEAHSLTAFFIKECSKSTQNTLRYLGRQMRRLKTKTPEQKTLKKQIIEGLTNAEQAISQATGGK